MIDKPQARIWITCSSTSRTDKFLDYLTDSFLNSRSLLPRGTTTTREPATLELLPPKDEAFLSGCRTICEPVTDSYVILDHYLVTSRHVSHASTTRGLGDHYSDQLCTRLLRFTNYNEFAQTAAYLTIRKAHRFSLFSSVFKLIGQLFHQPAFAPRRRRAAKLELPR